MIILPDRNIVRTKILKPIPNWQWRTPSQAQPKSEFGHENHTRFRATARLNGGHIVWRGWFDDRYDFDAFIHAMVSGTLLIQPALWDLPTPMWVPGMGEQLAYDFASTSYITTTATTSYTTPADWGTNNLIECIGGGGGGANGPSYSGGGTGGGGGAYAAGNVPGGGNDTYTIQIGGGGAQNSNGGNTWFGGSSFTTCLVGAQLGGRGFPNSATKGAGGTAASSIGDIKYDGGDGGAKSYGGGGGGGAAGPNGAGGNGANSSAATGGTGGNGDAGFGGAGGAMDNVGGNGTEYTASIGCGGGGGGGGGDAKISAGSKGGNYGAGGGAGGQSTSSGQPGAAGTQGFMVVTYTVTDDFFMFFH